MGYEDQGLAADKVRSFRGSDWELKMIVLSGIDCTSCLIAMRG